LSLDEGYMRFDQLTRSIVNGVVVAAVIVVIGQSWWLAATTTERPPLYEMYKMVYVPVYGGVCGAYTEVIGKASW